MTVSTTLGSGMATSVQGRTRRIARGGAEDVATSRSPKAPTVRDLRRAITNGELTVHYQPKIDLATAQAVGAEALVRWQNPALGLIFPDHFLPLAERGGLMAALTEFVLDSAAGQHAHWRALGLHLPVAVNLPPEALLDPALESTLTAICERTHINASGLTLEITETAVITDPVRTAATLTALAARGFEIALDDFGTGFSSLAHLRNLPVSVVKIDKSFVLDLTTSDSDARIVRGTIELARGLGKTVVAEGVEDSEAATMLFLMGCQQAQGYHWSKALPAHGLTAWLQARGENTTRKPANSRYHYPVPADEARRLAVLRQYGVLDTAHEAIFDEIATAAARVCGTGMAAISLVDTDRQWFKAQVGLSVRETSRNLAFCARTIAEPDRIMIVNDAHDDPRFADNELVTSDPNIRFYAGAPLVAPDGSAIGSLCVLDSDRRDLTSDQLTALSQLSRHVIALLEARLHLRTLAQQDVAEDSEVHGGPPCPQPADATGICPDTTPYPAGL